MIAIENDFLIVKAKEEGAELTSIVNKKINLEYLWQAGEAWTKHAPVLFPIVGQLKDNTYFYNNHSYKLERHGFARNKKFSVAEEGKEKMSFTLKEDEETIKTYPFHFELRITYMLDKNKLLVNYTVSNTGNKKIFFSIGGHPAFHVPLHKHESYKDYRLEFNRLENAERYSLQNGLLSAHKEFVIENDTVLHLKKTLFYDDALVFKNLESTKITLCSSKYPNGLHFYFEEFPYFGIWAAKDADFICLEPWHGIADKINHNQQLENKEGILNLDAGKSFSCEYGIETF